MRALAGLALAAVMTAAGCSAQGQTTYFKPMDEPAATATPVPTATWAPGPAVPASWAPWTSPDGSFTLYFPAQPESQYFSIDCGEFACSMTMFMSVDAKSKEAWVVAWVDLPASLASSGSADLATFLTSSQGGFTSATGATVTGSSAADFHGYAARRWTEKTKTGVTGSFLAFVTNQRLFMLGGEAASKSIPNFDAFVGSLRFT